MPTTSSKFVLVGDGNATRLPSLRSPPSAWQRARPRPRSCRCLCNAPAQGKVSTSGSMRR
eukprot:7393492-Pyramimonas_sp.AAC.1